MAGRHFFDILNDGGTPSSYPMENLYRTVGAAVTPGSTGSDIVMATYTLPAGFLNYAGRGLDVYVQGGVTNNANTKTAKIIVGATSAVVGSAVSGGTTVASAAFTTSGGGMIISASLYKYGVYGANTQVALHTAAQGGATVTALSAASALTLTESSAIIIAFTINCATTATDMSFNLLEIDSMN